MVNQINNKMLPVQTYKSSLQVATPEQKKLMKTCIDFEAIMVQKMLEEMQSTTKMFGEGFGGDYFQSMFQSEIAKQVAGNGEGMGLAKMLYQQLNKSRTVK